MKFQKELTRRVVIHPKDVENITGLASRTARHLLQTIREAFGKEKFQFITVNEFCQFTGIEEEIVRENMLD